MKYKRGKVKQAILRLDRIICLLGIVCVIMALASVVLHTQRPQEAGYDIAYTDTLTVDVDRDMTITGEAAIYSWMTKEKVLGKLPKGTIVRVDCIVGEWAILSGSYDYVESKYLEYIE